MEIGDWKLEIGNWRLANELRRQVRRSPFSNLHSPTQSQRISMEFAVRGLRVAVGDYNVLLNGALATFKHDADGAGLQLLGELEPLSVR